MHLEILIFFYNVEQPNLPIGPLYFEAVTLNLWPWPWKSKEKLAGTKLTHRNQYFGISQSRLSKMISGKHRHLESLLLFYNVKEPKILILLLPYRCCYGNSFGLTQQVTIISKPTKMPNIIKVLDYSYLLLFWAYACLNNTLWLYLGQILAKWPWPFKQECQGHLEMA